MSPIEIAAPPSDLASLAAEINEHHRHIEVAIGSALDHAHKAGVLLRQAKGQCKHGDWRPWLKTNFSGSIRTAQLYMTIADPYNWEHIQNRNTVAHLAITDKKLPNVREAVKLLAKPKPAKVAVSHPQEELADHQKIVAETTGAITHDAGPYPDRGVTERFGDENGRYCQKCKAPCGVDDGPEAKTIEAEPVDWTNQMKKDLANIEQAYSHASVMADRITEYWPIFPTTDRIKVGLVGVQDAIVALSKAILYSGILDNLEADT